MGKLPPSRRLVYPKTTWRSVSSGSPLLTSYSHLSVYLHASQLNGGSLAGPTYSSYTYTSPVCAYDLAETPTHLIQVTKTKEHTLGPLDFSKFTTKDVNEVKRSFVQWENFLHPLDLATQTVIIKPEIQVLRVLGLTLKCLGLIQDKYKFGK